MAEEANKKFNIQRVYIKDVSFESPGAPGVFSKRIEPEAELGFAVAIKPLGESRYDIVLTVTVTASHEGQVVFVCEVAQGGVFAAHGFVGAELEELINVTCPRHLFPFVRSEIAHLTTLGGFPPVLLSPVSFEKFYAASKRAPVANA